MSEALAQAIDEQIIDPDYHQQLLADLPALVRQAGITERYVWNSMREYCTPDEIAFIMGIKQEDCPLGLYYVGKFETPVIERMMAMAGACLRNYLNAKVMTVYDVLECLKEGTMPSPTVLLIPDFFEGGSVPEWKRTGLLSLLYKREQQGKKTILYVANKTELRKAYGEPFMDHIQNKFVEIKETEED